MRHIVTSLERQPRTLRGKPGFENERAYPEAVYLRGLAYLGLREGAEARAEFEKILDHKGANCGSAWQHPYWGQYYSLSYLGLARASALAGDAAKARKAFQDFFAL